MAFLLERDSINGKDGKAFLIRNGRTTQLFHCKNIEADATINESDFPVTGTRIIQKVPGGMQYGGTLTLYYGSSILLDMIMDYQGDLSTIPYFDLQIVNDDKSSSVGKRTVTLKNCKLSGTIPISKLNAEQDVLDEQANFSYSYIERLNEFGEVERLGGIA